MDQSDDVEVALSGRGRIRYVYLRGEHALTLRPTTGLFTIGLPMAKLIVGVEDPPRFRVVVKGDRPLKGSVLARDLVDIDYDIRPGDEVVIVDKDDNVLGVGRAKVSAMLAKSLEFGEVVRVR